MKDNNGGILGSYNEASVLSAPGVWNLEEQYKFGKANQWPGALSFSVTPSSSYEYFADDTYIGLVFTASATFTVDAGSSDLEYVVVAGGGGGGHSSVNAAGGGAGAGGYRTGTFPGFGPGTYPITIGGGGNGGTSPGAPSQPTAGSPSVFHNITSAGGGIGGWPANGAGGNGGSGGGGGTSYNAGTGVAYTLSGLGGSGNTPPTSPPQGNNGGRGAYESTPPGNFASGGGGGGGGAGGAGGNTNAPAMWGFGNPGPGTTNTWDGSSRTLAVGGIGGSSGGGPGTPGSANTGNGGGGAGGVSPQNPGGSGGSGIVILRWTK